MHKTNKAFERYMQSQSADAMKVYKKANELTGKKGKVIPFASKASNRD